MKPAKTAAENPEKDTPIEESEVVKTETTVALTEKSADEEELKPAKTKKKPAKSAEKALQQSADQVADSAEPVQTKKVINIESADPEVAGPVAEAAAQVEVLAEAKKSAEPAIEQETEVAKPVAEKAEVTPAAEAETLIPAGATEIPAEAEQAVEESEMPDVISEAEVAAAEEHTDDLSHLSREQLVTMLEETVQNDDANEIKNKVALIKVAYLALTNKEKQEMYQKAAESEGAETFEISDIVEERYKAAFGIYKHNKLRFTEEQEKIKHQNLEAKKKILEELKVLINSEETLKKTYDEFKAIQERWKEIGMVPKAEAQGIWQNYHFLIEKFFDKVKINKELKDLDLRKNLAHKIELCEKAEELLLEPSLNKSFKRLQELHEEWKEIGPVATDKRDEVWDRFKSATEKINDRRHEHYKKIQGDLDANYAAKVVLCEKAEVLVADEYNSTKQWQDSTQKLNELLKMWKSIGPAPSKVNNEIWLRFKTQLDQYFTNKKEYFGKLKDVHLHNYNLKVDLCLQAESHRLSNDWKNSSRELIRLQDEWKKIGPVPRKHSDKIWKRFRTACDAFFTAKSQYFKDQSAGENENLKSKQQIVEKLVAFEYGANKHESLNSLKDLQREWMEIGHVPIKEKDKLQAEYKAAVNKIYEKLKIDSAEAGNISYKSRFDNLKDQPDANRIISRERNGLQTKIDSLREEILLWENNIGFFANSKQANVLKAEFEAKIAHAKEELAALEAKMKFLRNAVRDQQ